MSCKKYGKYDFIDYASQFAYENIGNNSKPKPPLGLTPKFIVEEKRMEEIHRAIMRYKQAKKDIPVEWLNEYAELCGKE